ncbi:MAG: OstA-like protein [Flavobacteriaceae bacterium]|nr:OstA-like protein [Flavobacteriaceae bacterium]MCY4267399.1 OstA-like protein [Flavobacteriaceae bacterium]
MQPFCSVVWPQENEKIIEIQQAGSATRDDALYPGATILNRSETKRVHLFHQGALIVSDYAIFYPEQNHFNARGNVVFTQGDSITMTSQRLNYNGNTRIAQAIGSVHLIRTDMDLKTNTLELDRIQNQVYYNTEGVIIDSINTLTSQQGVYYVNQKKYRFLSDVVIKNPDYTINSERLDYFTELNHAFLYGPTEILGQDYLIQSERGFYDMDADTGIFKQNAVIHYDNKIIYGDSLYFNNGHQYAAATSNIKLIDTINRSIIEGHYGEIFKARDSAIITNRALATNIFDNDSLYIHGDTLIVTGPEDKRIFKAFYDVRLFKSDIQGKSDSLYIDESSGLIKLLKRPPSKKELQIMTAENRTNRNPVMWFDKTQMTGDIIKLLSNPYTRQLDSLHIDGNVFIIEKDTLSDHGYNQIIGAKLRGDFDDGKLNSLDITKNTTMVYYLYSDESFELIGIDKTTCSAMRMEFELDQVVSIRFLGQPEGKVYPEVDLNPNERILEGFSYRIKEKPTGIDDLFSQQDNAFQIPMIQPIPFIREEEEEVEEEIE